MPLKQLTRPCAKCPFRNDIPAYLTKDRVEEIEEGCVGRQGEFYCHATCDYDTDENEGEGVPGENAVRCAGLTILMEKLRKSTQMMRIEERLGMYDHRKMDMTSPIFDSFEEMIKAQNG